MSRQSVYQVVGSGGTSSCSSNRLIGVDEGGDGDDRVGSHQKHSLQPVGLAVSNQVINQKDGHESANVSYSAKTLVVERNLQDRNLEPVKREVHLVDTNL